MLLESKDGIGCDFCSVPARHKFSYYSVQFKRVVVNNQTVNIGNIEWDIEICQGCYTGLLDRCRQFLTGTRAGVVKCDLCPKYSKGNFEYIIAKCDCVTVDKDADPSTTVKQNVMDFNICSECFVGLRNSTVKATKPSTKNNQWTVGA